MKGRTESPARAKQAARTRRRRQQTEGEILDAAREVVLREGVASFKLAAVAAELGLTTPALYYYFPSREALVGALLVGEWLAAAEQVEAAVDATEGAAAAVEALMRTTFARYRDHLDLFSLTWRATLNQELEGLVGPDELERVRPVNEMLYGETERRLRAAQRTGAFPRKRNPRRFAFTAHMAVIGVLNMMAIAAAASDPLIHAPDDLIDDLCETFCAVTRKGGAR